jgi:hypothetical protein
MKGGAEGVVEEKEIQEFMNVGLLWFVNSIIHVFGWAIVVECDDFTKIPIRMFPARVKFRGFAEKNNTDGYIRVSKYMKDNASDLLREAKE